MVIFKYTVSGVLLDIAGLLFVRALAIAVFDAMGRAVGGLAAPYVFGAVLMVAAVVVVYFSLSQRRGSRWTRSPGRTRWRIEAARGRSAVSNGPRHG